MSKYKRLLLDADGMVLTSALRAQKVIEWEDGVFTTHASLDDASFYLHEQISLITEKLECEDFTLCFSDPKRRYFRHDIYPEYKSARTESTPLMALKALTAKAEEDYPSVVIPNLEADDVMGILATNPANPNQVIVSVDKDMKQIPGFHADPSKLDEGVHEVEDVDAERYLWEQVLTGDTVDGYPGLKGVGPVTAARILDKAEANEMLYEEAVWNAYKKAGATKEFFQQMVNVARILKFNDYTDEVKLWRTNFE